MFTIKHSTDKGDHIFFGYDVKYTNNSESIANSKNPDAKVTHHFTVMTSEGRVTHFLNDGMVYVMNDHGSTVAKYRMYEIE